MVIEISIALVTLAFVALVIYIIILVESLRATLRQVNLTLIDVRKQLDEMGGDVKKTVEQSHQITSDLKRKMESLDSIFNTVSNIGEIFQHKTSALKRAVLAQDEEEGFVNPKSVKARDFLELTDIGLRLWQKLKKRR